LFKNKKYQTKTNKKSATTIAVATTIHNNSLRRNSELKSSVERSRSRSINVKGKKSEQPSLSPNKRKHSNKSSEFESEEHEEQLNEYEYDYDDEDFLIMNGSKSHRGAPLRNQGFDYVEDKLNHRNHNYDINNNNNNKNDANSNENGYRSRDYGVERTLPSRRLLSLSSSNERCRDSFDNDDDNHDDGDEDNENNENCNGDTEDDDGLVYDYSQQRNEKLILIIREIYAIAVNHPQVLGIRWHIYYVSLVSLFQKYYFVHIYVLHTAISKCLFNLNIFFLNMRCPCSSSS
jgi:hypothetical protein